LVYRGARQVQALGYPITKGKITAIDVVKHRGESSTNELKVEYQFDVAGKHYTGSRYRYGMANSSDKWAENYRRAHPVGTPVQVHYHPVDPTDAVLTAGVEGEDLMIAIFLTPFTCVMLGMWWACWIALRPARGDLVAGGLPLVDTGGQVVARMPGISPLAIALAVLGAAGFSMVFVLGLSTGLHPPLWLAIVAWCVLLGAAAIAYVMVASSRWQGKYDLRVDRIHDYLVLPANFGRIDHVQVPFDRISGIGVHQPISAKANRSNTTQQVVVYERNDGGSTNSHVIAEFYEPSPAESLAEFLRTEIASKL
jgi:hypothetical protein